MSSKSDKGRAKPWIFRFIQISVWFPALAALFLLVELMLYGYSTPLEPTITAFKIIVLLAIFTAFILILDYMTELHDPVEDITSDAGILDSVEVSLPDISDLDALVACYRKCQACEDKPHCIPGSAFSEDCENSDTIQELEELIRIRKELGNP